MAKSLSQYLFFGETADDGIIPYLSVSDFPGLQREERTFRNSRGQTVKYWFYGYETAHREKIILFLHGVGPGHKSYLREIETFCSFGYRVLTLDYAGCGESDGDHLESLYAPARDTLELLAGLNLSHPIIPVGHSLGGFTALNLLCHAPNLTVGVLLSPLYSAHWCAERYPDREEIEAYERQVSPDLCDTDLDAFLQSTKDRILFIHSTDDTIVPFSVSTGHVIQTVQNPNLSFQVMEHRKHNPNYTDRALAYMSRVFGTYGALIARGKLNTFEEKKEFMADKSAMEMTHQDPAVFWRILDWIEA